ncbi:MAG: c-type cytochrome [Sandaracinaceae bacterium]
MARRTLATLVVVASALAALGCRGTTKTEPPIGWIRNMHEVPRYDAQERSTYFPDERTMRPPVPGAVPRGVGLYVDPVLNTGVHDDGEYVMTIPEQVVQEAEGFRNLVARGRDRYEVYCVPCHGSLGNGQGLVGQRSGLLVPPTFHDDRLRTMPDGQVYATIRNGIRTMPAYQASIPPADRWAIVSYVRALQVSQYQPETAALQGEADR